ncbi:hypothetical protein F2Q69_00059577 [Brassica cretica]|uniref:Uncharacterized protein n=1 Tax=Brassica cretica TaxID=69181 RepID=A0A8S9RED5_BRACR|nr:hypothetical protein F2Q69_00059577 [Brassica cretica]
MKRLLQLPSSRSLPPGSRFLSLGSGSLPPGLGPSFVLQAKDDRWREKFFVFKINPASVATLISEGSLGSGPTRLPFGSAPMNPELHGLISTQRRGNPQWLAFTVDRIRAAYALPPGKIELTLLVWLLLFDQGRVGVTKERGRRRRYPIILTSPLRLAFDDDVDSSTHRRRRRAIENINSVISNSPNSGLPLPLRASGEGTSRVDPSAHLPEASSWRFSYDNEVPILENPEHLTLIWRKIRERGCELPSLGNMRERDPYVWMAVANAKATEASNEYAAMMENRLADFPSKEEVGSHLLTIPPLRGELEAVRVTEQQRGVEIEGLKGKLAAAETEKVAVQNDLDLMKEKHRREIEDAVLAVVKDKLQKKKKEIAAAIRLQELRARIETMSEYIEGGFELDEEFERLRGQEISLDLDYGLASVSDPSLSRIELPEISGDSVDQE